MKLFNSNTPLLMVPDFGDLEILPYNPNNKPMLPDGGCGIGGNLDDLLQMLPFNLELPKEEPKKKPIYWITC